MHRNPEQKHFQVWKTIPIFGCVCSSWPCKQHKMIWFLVVAEIIWALSECKTTNAQFSVTSLILSATSDSITLIKSFPCVTEFMMFCCQWNEDQQCCFIYFVISLIKERRNCPKNVKLDLVRIVIKIVLISASKKNKPKTLSASKMLSWLFSWL